MRIIIRVLIEIQAKTTHIIMIRWSLNCEIFLKTTVLNLYQITILNYTIFFYQNSEYVKIREIHTKTLELEKCNKINLIIIKSIFKYLNFSVLHFSIYSQILFVFWGFWWVYTRVEIYSVLTQWFIFRSISLKKLRRMVYFSSLENLLIKSFWF